MDLGKLTRDADVVLVADVPFVDFCHDFITDSGKKGVFVGTEEAWEAWQANPEDIAVYEMRRTVQ